MSALYVSGNQLISGSLDGTIRTWDMLDVYASDKQLLPKEPAPVVVTVTGVEMTAEEEAELADLMD